MTEAMLEHRLEQLTNAVAAMSAALGTRLTRQQMCERLGITRNTLRTRIHGPKFPLPGKGGKWLLSDVIKWEQGK